MGNYGTEGREFESLRARYRSLAICGAFCCSRRAPGAALGWDGEEAEDVPPEAGVAVDVAEWGVTLFPLLIEYRSWLVGDQASDEMTRPAVAVAAAG